MRVYFYEVAVDGGPDFMTVAGQVRAKRGANRTTVVTSAGGEARMEQAQLNPCTFAADLVRIRMQNVPAKIRRSGGTEDIALDPDQGIGEETALLYDAKTGVLALQSNQTGVSAGGVASYFTNLNDSGAIVSLTPILDLSQLQDLQELSSCSRMEIAVTGDSEIETLTPPESLGSMLQVGRDFEAPRLEITLSTGHSWRSSTLPLERVREWARFLFRRAKDKTLTLKVTGRKGNEEEQVMLDLLKGRLYYDAQLSIRARRPSFATRLHGVREGFEKHLEDGKFSEP